MNRGQRSKILVADDNASIRMMISKILEGFGHSVVTVNNGQEVLEVVEDSFDLVILDIYMPVMDGFQIISVMKNMGLDMPVLFLSETESMDNAIKAFNLGVYDFLKKPIDNFDIFNVKIRRALEKRMFILKEKKERISLENKIEEKTLELEEKNRLLQSHSRSLEQATLQMMSSFQYAMEEKDEYTSGHTTRVTDYAIMLGKAMELPEKEQKVLQRAAQFHDIGKLVIDLSCIQKPGALNDEEWLLIKKHPVVGENIIKRLGFMEQECFIIRHHHERVDGNGYPDGLRGDELCTLTKILMVVDSYDAMTSKRNYRRNFNMEEALAELYSCSGTQFDREIVEYFSRAIVAFTLPASSNKVYTYNTVFSNNL